MQANAVFFDLYNTLAGFDPPREVLQGRAAAEFGLTLSKAGVDAGYHLADAFMAAQNSTAPVRSLPAAERETFFARYQQLVLRGSGHDVDLGTAGRMWAEVRKQAYSLALFPDVVLGLMALREVLTGEGRRPVLAVISNMNASGPEVCRDLGLTGHIDFAVTSRDTGHEKPHPPIFLAALERAGVRPGDAVHVGDQLDSDISGALSVGIRPVLMDRAGLHRDYVEHPRVGDMPGLVALLGGV